MHVSLVDGVSSVGNVGLYGTGILFEDPNPTGSRPSDLIGLCRQHTKPAPQHTRKGREDKGISTGEKEQLRRGGGPTGAPLRLLFKRETEHLSLRQLI